MIRKFSCYWISFGASTQLAVVSQRLVKIRPAATETQSRQSLTTKGGASDEKAKLVTNIDGTSAAQFLFIDHHPARLRLAIARRMIL